MNLELNTLMLVLALMTSSNYILGIYNSINVFGLDFDKKKAINGIVKIIALCYTIYAFTYSLKEMDKLGYEIPGDMILPTTILVSAIFFYMYKVGKHLMHVLGITEVSKISKKEKVEEPKEQQEPKEDIEEIDDEPMILFPKTIIKTPLEIMKEKYVFPAQFSTNLTGSVKPYYNSFKSPSYFKGTGQVHYGVDLVPGVYKAIGDGVVEMVSKTVGGGVVIRHELDQDNDLFAIYWHGKPLVKVGDKVSLYDKVSDSNNPYKMKYGKHTHFEIRIVPKGTKFVYKDKKRNLQAIEPFLLPKGKDLKYGQKIINNMEYKGL